MNRRALLRTFAAATASVTGCLASTTDENVTTKPGPTSTKPTTSTPTTSPTYEQCERFVIPISMLPAPIQREVDDALENGPVTKSRILLTEAMDVDESYLWRDETYYEATVTEQGEECALRVSPVERPTFPDPVTISVWNDDEEPHEITVQLTHDENKVVERTIDLPVGTYRRFDATRRFGRYELVVEVPGYDPLTAEIEFDHVYFGIGITIDADEIWYDQAVAAAVPCPWHPN